MSGPHIGFPLCIQMQKGGNGLYFVLKRKHLILAGAVALTLLAAPVIHHAAQAAVPAVAAPDTNWGLHFQQEGQPPTANATAEYLKQFDAFYIGQTEEKKLAVTFDAGYEAGYTPKILDALKKHHVKATFFVVGNYLETSPDLVKRMVQEGHTVGNHTYHHYDMSKIASAGDFAKELQAVEEKYQEITGQQMKKIYRPPQGKYSESNLQQAHTLGYQTVFWSLAYVDWNRDAQPSPQEAFSKLLPRTHPGAVVLLHSTSQTNADILDELLGKWEEQGYQFVPIDAFLS